MTVLVAYDGSEPARKAAEYAFTEYPDEEIVLLRVVEAADGFTDAGIEIVRDFFEDRESEAAEEMRADVAELVDADDPEFRTEVAIGKPAREIVRFAEEHDVDHIVVGNHGRSDVSRVLLGSVAERVVRRAPIPVTVVR